jgi:hypothetical protein
MRVGRTEVERHGDFCCTGVSVCEKLAEQRDLGGLGVEAAYPPHAGDRSGN